MFITKIILNSVQFWSLAKESVVLRRGCDCGARLWRSEGVGGQPRKCPRVVKSNRREAGDCGSLLQKGVTTT